MVSGRKIGSSVREAVAIGNYLRFMICSRVLKAVSLSSFSCRWAFVTTRRGFLISDFSVGLWGFAVRERLGTSEYHMKEVRGFAILTRQDSPGATARALRGFSVRVFQR